MKKARAKIGVIGGSGLYDMERLKDVRPVKIETPFGPHSGPLMLGRLNETACAFLPRHGKGHKYLPSELPALANIYALKSLGVERIISVGAVGSLREDVAPRDFLFPDQLVDRTKGRRQTFFGDGVVAHIAFADPFCSDQTKVLYDCAKSLGIHSHLGGTYCCMEGPAFSTRAESEFHRKMGYSIIGMTVVPEAKLAREAEICYSSVGLITDYDCWKEGEEVSTSKVVENLFANIANAQNLLEHAVGLLARRPRNCSCKTALSGALFTQPGAMAPGTVKKLELLIGKYLKK